MFLMPSQYEPCGLNQMYSLRYGTIPIVRRTGGLADSVRHFDPASGEGTGCVFNDYDSPAALWAMNTALDWFDDGPSWLRLMQNAHARGLLVGTSGRAVRRVVPHHRSASRFEQRVTPPVRQRIAMRDFESRRLDPGRKLSRRVRGHPA